MYIFIFPSLPITQIFCIEKNDLLKDEQIQQFLCDGYLILNPQLRENFHEELYEKSYSSFIEHGHPNYNINQ